MPHRIRPRRRRGSCGRTAFPRTAFPNGATGHGGEHDYNQREGRRTRARGNDAARRYPTGRKATHPRTCTAPAYERNTTRGGTLAAPARPGTVDTRTQTDAATYTTTSTVMVRGGDNRREI